jgi:hypothetical protein
MSIKTRYKEKENSRNPQFRPTPYPRLFPNLYISAHTDFRFHKMPENRVEYTFFSLFATATFLTGL